MTKATHVRSSQSLVSSVCVDGRAVAGVHSPTAFPHSVVETDTVRHCPLLLHSHQPLLSVLYCRSDRKGIHTGTNDLNLDSLLSCFVVATLVGLWGLDGGGEQSVDEGSLSETRFT